jgi:hypothetical protein
MNDTPPTIGSNSLAKLAARIRAEHEASGSALKRGAAHAMNAGDLLIEAKAQLKHGQWLPWLEGNCAISERTAQLYMRMAKARSKIEGVNPQHVADLSLRGAMAVIAPPTPDIDIWEWAAQQLEKPFTDWDVNNHRWMQTKLAHCVGLPINLQRALGLARDYGLPVLAVCSAEEIMEALSLIAPYARREGKSKLEMSDDHLGGRISILMAGQALVVALFGEIEAREKLSDDRLAERPAKVIKALSLAIDAKMAKWAELRARSISDEAKFEAALRLGLLEPAPANAEAEAAE